MHQRRCQFALFAAIFALAAALYTAVPPARADQQPDYSFKAEVNEVQLTFVATDQHNRDIATLTPTDIAVVDNGTVIRRFRSLGRYPQSNLEVLVLIDASQSLARRFSEEMAEAAQLIQEARWRPDDALSIMSFAGLKTSAVCARNCRDLPPAAWLSKIHAGGETPLLDAVVLGVEFLAKNCDSTRRPVLIVLSDGHDTISRYSFRDAAIAAIRANVPIYTLNTGGPETTASGGGVLRDMAVLTGGGSFTRAPGASSALAAMVEELRKAYVLTYALPGHAEGLHSVSILPTTNFNLRLRSRRAYYYASTDSSAPKE
ncbi:MAG: VWA domain-containing protein [Candidatus Korobacteraceae bacterium]